MGYKNSGKQPNHRPPVRLRWQRHTISILPKAPAIENHLHSTNTPAGAAGKQQPARWLALVPELC